MEMGRSLPTGVHNGETFKVPFTHTLDREFHRDVSDMIFTGKEKSLKCHLFLLPQHEIWGYANISYI